MRKLFTHLAFLLGTLLVLSGSSAFAQKTIVYVVRHAEKDLSNPSERNPQLSVVGKQRAEDLKSLLGKQAIAAVLSTDYVRTRQTAGPLVESNGLTIQTYSPTDYRGVAEKVKKEFAGKKVLIVGHSNTVPGIVKALGGNVDRDELSEEDYDYLFQVTLLPNGKVKTKTSHYGTKARKG